MSQRTGPIFQTSRWSTVVVSKILNSQLCLSEYFDSQLFFCLKPIDTVFAYCVCLKSLDSPTVFVWKLRQSNVFVWKCSIVNYFCLKTRDRNCFCLKTLDSQLDLFENYRTSAIFVRKLSTVSTMFVWKLSTGHNFFLNYMDSQLFWSEKFSTVNCFFLSIDTLFVYCVCLKSLDSQQFLSENFES